MQLLKACFKIINSAVKDFIFASVLLYNILPSAVWNHTALLLALIFPSIFFVSILLLWFLGHLMLVKGLYVTFYPTNFAFTRFYYFSLNIKAYKGVWFVKYLVMVTFFPSSSNWSNLIVVQPFTFLSVLHCTSSFA